MKHVISIFLLAATHLACGMEKSSKEKEIASLKSNVDFLFEKAKENDVCRQAIGDFYTSLDNPDYVITNESSIRILSTLGLLEDYPKIDVKTIHTERNIFSKIFKKSKKN